MVEEKHTTTMAKIWEGDALNRSKDAEILRTFTIGHLNLRENAGEPRTYVLNLDANWGAGKSFFLNRFKKHLEAHGHISVYVNAWENDHSNDPFMTVVDEIQAELSARLSEKVTPEVMLERTAPFRKSAIRIIGGALFTGGKHWAVKYIGQEAIEGISELWENDDPNTDFGNGESNKIEESIRIAVDSAVDTAGSELLSQFRLQKEVQENFRCQLTEIGKDVLNQDGIETPIFILIDELDRCRPSYAIELLERVKHIFSLENFVFILGTDTRQLANAIKGVYGSEFDGERYLKRFVDRTYHFQDSPKNQLIDFALKRNGLSVENFVPLPGYDVITFLSECFSKGKTEARDIRQIVEIIGTFVATMPVSTRKIDIASLLPQVYKRHFNLSDSQLDNCDLANITFAFTSRSREGGGRFFQKKYKDVWRDIERNSIDNFNNSDPQNSLEHWIQKKNYAELKELFRVTQVNRREESVGQEYARILDQMANISGPSGDE
ncbi:KAP family P-loop NTPase fold protein [Epibacterium sp. Ofav1-8]|uniref:KAP family P-loop NTPase fold protein n=1 Tax=Epibacterium sp. Ofav1-8 TaxID=2917735 RepID=UPI001EF6C74A|nr:P-loop NTPase fold protein [Epibacterium sp. Ofav1-8]MCG7622297.1 KAP family NTPase [Epibacterium sp. Ofav1-8]